MTPLVPSLIGLAAAVVLSFASGYKVRGDEEKAKQLTLERGWHEAYKQDVVRNKGIAEQVGAALRIESYNRNEEMAKLRAKLDASRRSGSVRLATCSAAPEQIHIAEKAFVVEEVRTSEPDSVLLTPDFRLRFDTALSLVVPSGDRAGWVAAAGAAAGPAGLWEVLDNITENASRWGQCREQMTAAQNWFRAMGWVR